MILLRLSGGLGNQIFQLSAALLLAKRIGKRKIHIDISGLDKYDVKHKNELIYFFNFKNIEIEYTRSKIIDLRIPKILPLQILKYPFIGDKNFQCALKYPNHKIIILDGYFQESLTQQDFNNEIKILKKELIFKNNFNEGCIIHIRGGDFVKLGWNIVTPKEYYLKAIESMQKKYKQNKFYVVTDDKEYSKTILNKLIIDYEFIGNNVYEDFKLIGIFNYRILSSSTFALWASALGNNKNSIVIAPPLWRPNHKRNIYLQNEIRIEF